MSHSSSATSSILTKDLSDKIDNVLETFGNDPTRLVGMLLEVQDIVPKQYIPKEIAVYIGEKIDVPLSRVYDVISFYEALSDVPRAEIVIQLCDSVVCKVTGNTGLKANLEQMLGIRVGETTPDGKYHLEKAPCFGACDVSPAIRVNGVVYGHLTSAEAVKNALEQFEKRS
jgi:NADH-quinone oxidoreductase subunit E